MIWAGQRPRVHKPVGTPMDAANVRRDLRRALGLVPGIEPGTGPLASCGTPSSQCCPMPASRSSRSAQLVGHSGTTVTELVYRHQLRPVIQTGATVMDRLFAPEPRPTKSGK